MSVQLNLNGRPDTIASPKDTPLLWALRDEKNLVGVKFGCGAGLCGACTVSVDGQQMRSCQTQVADVAGKTIMIVSMDDTRFRHPVRPGDVLRLHVDVLRHRGDLFKFRGKAMIGDILAAEADFAAMVVATPTL